MGLGGGVRFLFSHAQVLWWSQILVIHSLFRAVVELHLSAGNHLGLWGFKSETGALLSGSFSHSEEIRTVNKWTSKRFQLVKRATKKTEQREMKWWCHCKGYFRFQSDFEMQNLGQKKKMLHMWNNLQFTNSKVTKKKKKKCELFWLFKWEAEVPWD